MEELFRSGGETVQVCSRHPNGVTPDEYHSILRHHRDAAPLGLALDEPQYEFLRKQGFRLKVSRFRGQVSQGLALPLAVLPSASYAVVDDVTALTGIRKYEKPLSPNLVGVAKGAFPSWMPKTDEPNLRVAREQRLREALATLGGDFALQGEVHGEPARQ